MLCIVASYRCMKFQGKLINETWENGKKPSFRIDFGPKILCVWILLLQDVRHCYNLSVYAVSRKNYEANLKKWRKSWGPFSLNSGCHFFFIFKNLVPSVTRNHSQLSSCTISEKINDPILRKLSHGRTDGQTDRQTDWQEWFYRTLFD